MKVNFQSWELTDEHTGTNGRPMLVNEGSGEVLGPADIVRAHPTWAFMPAADAVRRMARMVTLSDKQRELVESFVGGAKG